MEADWWRSPWYRLRLDPFQSQYQAMRELREPTIFIIRHGATSFNQGSDSTSRLKGTRFDLPLTDEGHEQAKKAGEYLSQFPIESVQHSDLLRSSQTARHIEQATGKKSSVNDALDPWDVGYLSGHTRESARARIEYYIKHPDKVVPEGQSYNEFYDPWDKSLAKDMRLAEKAHNSPTFNALVRVTHSCNVAALPSVLDQSEPKFHSETGEKPGGIIKIHKRGGHWHMSDVDIAQADSR
jgi:broad specificity phosphatase PhoE